MSFSAKSKGISDEKFAPWLRHELWVSVKLGLLYLLITGAMAMTLGAISDNFSARWSRFNYQLSSVALDQHPVAIVRTFAAQLADNEYGWGPVVSSSPFNVTEAVRKLRADFPEVASVVDGVPQVPRSLSLRAANEERYDARITEFTRRYKQIQKHRFSSVYAHDDVFSAPNANLQLSIMVTKVFGFPDAFFHTVKLVFSGGPASAFLFIAVLAIEGLALWHSRRPARVWLKLIFWPVLASTLVWAAIFFMAVAAVIFGNFTPNTSALTFIACIPLLYTIARAPLHLAESLVAKPAKWDGVERRKGNRPPPPAAPAAPSDGSGI